MSRGRLGLWALTIAGYLGAGLIAVGGASFVASQFMPRAQSQPAPPPPPLPPVPKDSLSGATAVGPAPAVPATAPANTGAVQPPAPAAASAPEPPAVAPVGVAPVVAPSKPAKIDTKALLGNDLLVGVIEDYNYDPAGKRDPFLPFETVRKDIVSRVEFELQKFDLDQLKLQGVIWSVKEPKALLLDPTGKTHTVKMNERLGRNNGYVARIREGEIVIVESFKGNDGNNSYQTKLLKITPE